MRIPRASARGASFRFRGIIFHKARKAGRPVKGDDRSAKVNVRALLTSRRDFLIRNVAICQLVR
jgi:hypothetical protein